MNLCRTIRKDEQCAFAGKGGMCEYIGDKCYQIVEDCNDCNNIVIYNEKSYCKIYMSPDAKWYSAECCPMCTTKEKKIKEGQKINPLKASKRAAKARKASK